MTENSKNQVGKNFGETDNGRPETSPISKELKKRKNQSGRRKIPEVKTEKMEREYIIPLREKVRVVPRYKKTNKAVKTVKEFLVRHMKIRDRDLKKIKIDKYLNEALWFRGIRHPPHKIKVKAIKEGDIVRVELADMPAKLKFKKDREEKILQKAKAVLEGKKTILQKAKADDTNKPGAGKELTEEEKQEVGKKEEEKQKKSAVVEAGEEIAKAAAKQTKHATKTAGKMTQQKHQVRKALAK
jgi:large subunit ribosomal protein L31e